MELTQLAWTSAPAVAAVGTCAALSGAGLSGLVTAAGALAVGVAASALRPTAVAPTAPSVAPDEPAPVAGPTTPDVDVDALVRRMSVNSEHAVQEGEQLSSASTDVAVRFHSVGDAVQSLRLAIDDIAGGARDATAFADSALDHSTEAAARVQALRDASEEIDQVTGLITAITGQTRMLALNANIEAARAGSAGKGFSVVADEVKQLATATAAAAEQISLHVQAVRHSGVDAAGAIDQISETLRQMTAVQQTVTSAVGRQTDAAGQIAADVSEASRASDVIAELVEQRAASLRSSYVEQAVEVAQALLGSRGGLVHGDVMVPWQATDQFSRAVRAVSLPQLVIDGTPVLPNDDPSRPSVFVDEVQRLVGGTVTLFQRLDEEGAMLRVATTVLNAEGRRAVGTFQPVVKPDGSRNPVLAQVLAGRSFTGEAKILEHTYFTSYAPLRDATGRIAGAVYVGLRKD